MSEVSERMVRLVIPRADVHGEPRRRGETFEDAAARYIRTKLRGAGVPIKTLIGPRIEPLSGTLSQAEHQREGVYVFTWRP